MLGAFDEKPPTDSEALSINQSCRHLPDAFSFFSPRCWNDGYQVMVCRAPCQNVIKVKTSQVQDT